MNVSADLAYGIEKLQRIAGDDIPVYRDPSGEFMGCLGLIDYGEDRDHPVAIPSTLFVGPAGRLDGIFIAREANDRPRIELLILAAERFSQSRSEE